MFKVQLFDKRTVEVMQKRMPNVQNCYPKPVTEDLYYILHTKKPMNVFIAPIGSKVTFSNKNI